MYIILYSFVVFTLLQPYKAVSLQICCFSILLLCAPFNISSVHAKFKGSGDSLTQYMQKYSDMLQIVDGWNNNPHISTTTLLITLLVFWCILIIIFYPVLCRNIPYFDMLSMWWAIAVLEGAKKV